MIRPNFRNFRNLKPVIHSAKGSTWEDHKYIKRVDGTYYYPDSYEGGRHLPDGADEKSEEKTVEISSNDIESLASEVIRGNFANGEERKKLLGEYYEAIQKRVNEILKSGVGSKKISEVSEEIIEKVEEAAKNTSKPKTSSTSATAKGINMDEVLSVYYNKNK